MSSPVALVLLLVWLVLAYQSYQRGNLPLAGVFLLVGIALTVYRIRSAKKPAQPADPGAPTTPPK